MDTETKKLMQLSVQGIRCHCLVSNLESVFCELNLKLLLRFLMFIITFLNTDLFGLQVINRHVVRQYVVTCVPLCARLPHLPSSHCLPFLPYHTCFPRDRTPDVPLYNI